MKLIKRITCIYMYIGLISLQFQRYFDFEVNPEPKTLMKDESKGSLKISLT